MPFFSKFFPSSCSLFLLYFSKNSASKISASLVHNGIAIHIIKLNEEVALREFGNTRGIHAYNYLTIVCIKVW